MREKNCPCKWSTFSKFSYFSRESQWRRARAPSCFRVRVRRNISERLRILSDRYENSWYSQDENVNHKFKNVGRYKSTVKWKELRAWEAL